MISVIIPLYNKELSIAQTLDSVLGQEGADFEVVIVDDSSTDKSYAIAEEYAHKDTRIRLFQQENGGPAKARNTGARNAKSEWILFLDADDELLPNSLSMITGLIEYYPSFNIFDFNSCILWKGKKSYGYHPLEGAVNNPTRQWFFNKIGPGSGHSAFKRSLLLSCPYDERIRRYEDAELLTRLLINAKIYSCKKTILLVHADYSSASHPRENVNEDYFAYLKFHSGGFWQRMCAYKFFLENRTLYPQYGHKHYKLMYYRCDLLILYKSLILLNKIFG